MTFGTILIVWILCGLLAGAIGASRNVGFLLHAMIGFLFGPIGIITAILSLPMKIPLGIEGRFQG